MKPVTTTDAPVELATKVIVQWKVDAGERGILEGIFVTTPRNIKEACEAIDGNGAAAFFLEKPGVRPRLTAYMKADCFRAISDNPVLVKQLEEQGYLGDNPFDEDMLGEMAPMECECDCEGNCYDEEEDEA